jgi:hypothetical protein
VRGVATAFEPLPRGGGEDTLGIRGERGEQATAPLGVEFAENVVEQIERRGTAPRADQFGLREAEGEGERALLTLAGEGRGSGAVQFEEDVVAVRTDYGLAQASFFVGAPRQRGGEVVPSGTFVVQSAGFAARTDRSHVLGDKRRQFGAKFPPHAAEVLSGGKQRSVVSGNFASAMRAFFEQEVARAQGAFVSAEIFQITGVALAAEEIEEAATLRRRAADEFDVLVGKKRHQSGPEVFVGFALRQVIEGKFAAFGLG